MALDSTSRATFMRLVPVVRRNLMSPAATLHKNIFSVFHRPARSRYN
jgi:hypothetical protein